jgi:hypothetical protein
MIHLAEKIVFTLAMAVFALAVWMAVRPADRKHLPEWFQILIPRFFLKNCDLGRRTHALLYILFFLTWIPVIWLLE